MEDTFKTIMAWLAYGTIIALFIYAVTAKNKHLGVEPPKKLTWDDLDADE